MKSIETFIAGLDYLPPQPRHLTELGQIINQPEATIQQVVEVVRYDPALATQVIRLCNSIGLGYETPAAELEEAALRLGFDRIMQLATTLSACALLRPTSGQAQGSAARELWKHSVAAALVGKLIALDRAENPALVYTFCLLHDVGKMVLFRDPDLNYGALLSAAREQQTSLRATERAALGFDHAQIGGSLLEHWGFPKTIVEAVRYHHTPRRAPEHQTFAAYACLASQIAWFMDCGASLSALDLSGRCEAMELAGLDQEAVPHFMIRAYTALRDLAALMALPLSHE